MSSEQKALHLQAHQAPQEPAQPVFNSMIVKQEFPRRAVTPLPPILPNQEMPLETYRYLQKKDFSVDGHLDNNVRKTVYGLVKLRKHMWELRKARPSDEDWEEIGVEVYKRMDLILSVRQLRQIWVRGKDALRTRLKRALDKNLDDEQIDEQLWNTWDLYGHMLFYRSTLKKYEREVRKHLNGERADLRYIEEEEQEDERDVIFEGYVTSEPVIPAVAAPEIGREEEVVEEQEENLDRANPESETNQEPAQYDAPAQEAMMSPLTTFPTYQEYQNFPVEVVSPSWSVESAHGYATPLAKPNLQMLDASADHIREQALRVFREHPEQKTMARKALFMVLLAFDDSEYEDLGDLFEDLANQCKATSRKRKRAGGAGEQLPQP